MNEILAELQKVLVLAQAKEKELSVLVGKVNETAAQQKDLALKLTAKQAEIEGRETAVKGIEDLVKYRQEADTLIAQADASLQETNKRVTSFAAYEEAAKKEIGEQRVQNENKTAELAEREKNIEAVILEKVKSVLGK